MLLEFCDKGSVVVRSLLLFNHLVIIIDPAVLGMRLCDHAICALHKADLSNVLAAQHLAGESQCMMWIACSILVQGHMLSLYRQV